MPYLNITNELVLPYVHSTWQTGQRIVDTMHNAGIFAPVLNDLSYASALSRTYMTLDSLVKEGVLERIDLALETYKLDGVFYLKREKRNDLSRHIYRTAPKEKTKDSSLQTCSTSQ